MPQASGFAQQAGFDDPEGDFPNPMDCAEPEARGFAQQAGLDDPEGPLLDPMD